MNPTIEVILFDLGGVLVELGNTPIPMEWLPGDSQFNLSNWFASEIAKSFEKGLINAQTFAETLRIDLNIEASSEEIIQHFTDWPIGPFTGSHEILKSVENKFRLAVLSNTNELHWPRITSEFGISSYFEHIFASHRLKMAKPDLEIFEHVISEMNVEPNNILFMDDNQNNIKASKRLGIHGVHVGGIRQVHRTLFEVGAIDA
ncbi:HAD family hydrolase [Pleurocapsa sp. PCC 7319]|uniref:HAD family hydrolase n=1 Tax=Pleurocapsa sp. PCC 7319 TaxID=118161 RepID=UPI00034C1505|nr:HAD family phosphatase [Pleurocapsa sp. PCC 7319]